MSSFTERKKVVLGIRFLQKNTEKRVLQIFLRYTIVFYVNGALLWPRSPGAKNVSRAEKMQCLIRK